MNIGNILKKVAQVAVPLVAGAIAGPQAGAVAAGAMGAGAAAKWHGQKTEAAGGKPHHKVSAPVVAVGTAAGLGQAMTPEGVAKLCATLHQALDLVCGNPTLAMALIGVFVVGGHGGIGDIFKVLGRKS